MKYLGPIHLKGTKVLPPQKCTLWDIDLKLDIEKQKTQNL